MIARIAPDARVIDITHGIAPQSVLQGALVLRNTTVYMPVGVHLAVVDPGVGGERRAIAVRTVDGRVFVGPDNGLLILAAEQFGIDVAHELVDERYRLPDVSRTFHARDVFAPGRRAPRRRCADRGARAVRSSPSELVRVEVPDPQVGRSQISATVLAVDRFGNVATNARRPHLDGLGVSDGDRVEIRLTLDRYYAVVAGTFADAPPGELIVYEDSYGLVTLAISRGDAARLTGVGLGDELRIAVG